jgi:hypothetical protein
VFFLEVWFRIAPAEPEPVGGGGARAIRALRGRGVVACALGVVAGWGGSACCCVARPVAVGELGPVLGGALGEAEEVGEDRGGQRLSEL